MTRVQHADVTKLWLYIARLSRSIGYLRHSYNTTHVIHRFADFVEGSPHLMSNEVSVHAQEYGFGGSFFEDELFSTDEDDKEEEEGDMKPLSFMNGD